MLPNYFMGPVMVFTRISEASKATKHLPFWSNINDLMCKKTNNIPVAVLIGTGTWGQVFRSFCGCVMMRWATLWVSCDYSPIKSPARSTPLLQYIQSHYPRSSTCLYSKPTHLFWTPTFAKIPFVHVCRRIALAILL